MEGSLILIVILAVVVLVMLALPISWYNKLVRLRQLIRESWHNVDVQLRRRYDLIPNLVNVVKGYAQHEQQTLAAVIEARNRAEANHNSVASQAADEQAMVRAAKQLLAVVEAYPQLKASQNFLALQRELIETEDRIAAARRFYNANVREYNVSRTTFPVMLVAGMGDFPPADYFEVEDITTRQAPAVSLGAS
jgi:LemA protein